MPGSIRKRGKQTWELRIERGRDPETGQRLFRYKYVRGTKREAEQVLTDLLHKRDTGTDIAPTKITVAEYLDRWLRDYAQPNVGPTTLARYRGFASRLKPLLGRHRVQELRPAAIQAAYGQLLAVGGNMVATQRFSGRSALERGSAEEGPIARIPSKHKGFCWRECVSEPARIRQYRCKAT